MKRLIIIMAGCLLMAAFAGWSAAVSAGTADQIKKGSKEAATEIKEGAVQTGKAVVKTGKEIKEGAVKAGKAVVKTGKEIGKDFKKAFKETKDAVKKEFTEDSKDKTTE